METVIVSKTVSHQSLEFLSTLYEILCDVKNDITTEFIDDLELAISCTICTNKTVPINKRKYTFKLSYDNYTHLEELLEFTKETFLYITSKEVYDLNQNIQKVLFSSLLEESKIEKACRIFNNDYANKLLIVENILFELTSPS